MFLRNISVILSIENLLWLTIVTFISHHVGRLQESSVAII